MATVESKSKPSCPYCASMFEDKDALSKHIDRIHHSSDLMRAILGYSIFSP